MTCLSAARQVHCGVQGEVPLPLSASSLKQGGRASYMSYGQSDVSSCTSFSLEPTGLEGVANVKPR